MAGPLPSSPSAPTLTYKGGRQSPRAAGHRHRKDARLLPRCASSYQPRYNALLTNPPADPRTSTLYWNPTVRTNAKGEAELHFFTADGSGTFQATVEGLSRDGQPAQGTGTLSVKGK